jgi:hypothetical protein
MAVVTAQPDTDTVGSRLLANLDPEQRAAAEAVRGPV